MAALRQQPSASGLLRLTCAVIILLAISPCIRAFDPLDPTGNITITYDVTSWADEGYIALVRMYNNQQYRQIPAATGWNITWHWQRGEYIWNIMGAVASKQGDCSRVQFPGNNVPHSCSQSPVIVDLNPDGSNPATNFGNCRKSGYVGSWAQDPDNRMAQFEVTVGNAASNMSNFVPPKGLSLGLDSYTCTAMTKKKPSLFSADAGLRQTEALATYEAVCIFSEVQKRRKPKCCVSFSSFYNETIVPCASCACSCGNYSAAAQLCTVTDGQFPYMISTPNGEDSLVLLSDPRSLECSPDGCPVSVHFHIKDNYRSHWRAKVTISNRSPWVNYTGWNLVLKHPNVQGISNVNSFMLKTIDPYGVNNTVVLWGKPTYNTVLLPAGNGNGNVQSEILFEKGEDFTLQNGWPFPQKVLFNGEECVMPQYYPDVPKKATVITPFTALALSSLVLVMFACM